MSFINVYIYIYTHTHRVSQELRSILWDLIPELMSQNFVHTWVQFTTVQELELFKVQ